MMMKSVFRLAPSVSCSVEKVACLYGTWALSRFTQLNSGRVQPVLELEKVLSNQKEYIDSLEKRKLTQKFNATRIEELYEQAKKLKAQIRFAEKLKEDNVIKVQGMLKSLKEDTINPEEVKRLRENGKSIREELRAKNLTFNNINDELVDTILSLPNILDSVTPVESVELLREVTPTLGIKHWQKPDNIHWENIRSIGPYPHFVAGSGAYIELDLAAKCQKYLLQSGFVETGNVDFVKRILLEGTGLDPEQFLRVRENKVRQGSVAHATYLVGGASFPAFLALFAQSLLQNEDMLPIRYFVIGRSYEKKLDGQERVMQKSNIQAFVACRDEKEEDEEFLRLGELMEKFYTDTIGLTVQTNLLPAPQLQTYEKKKLSFVTKHEQIVVGDLAAVGDYVSKRLLCCYVDPKRSPKFLHLVTGQFLNVTDLLRPKSESATSNNSTDLSPPKDTSC